MRKCIYLHVVAMAISVGFSLADRGLLISVSISHFVEGYLVLLLVPALAALYVCPIVALVIAVRRQRIIASDFYGVVAEVGLTLGQVVALLPACSS